MSMRRPRPLFVFLLAALAVLAAAALAAANHGVNADNASNMSHLANSPKAGTTNSDLAFRGNLAFAGNYGGFRILESRIPPHRRFSRTSRAMDRRATSLSTETPSACSFSSRSTGGR
jgi:hypothetical protein